MGDHRSESVGSGVPRPVCGLWCLGVLHLAPRSLDCLICLTDWCPHLIGLRLNEIMLSSMYPWQHEDPPHHHKEIINTPANVISTLTETMVRFSLGGCLPVYKVPCFGRHHSGKEKEYLNYICFSMINRTTWIHITPGQYARPPALRKRKHLSEPGIVNGSKHF